MGGILADRRRGTALRRRRRGAGQSRRGDLHRPRPRHAAAERESSRVGHRRNRTMNLQHTCDRQAIEHLLADRLGEGEQSALELHLADCSSCRQYLDDLAADPRLWRDIHDYLSDGPTAEVGATADADHALAGLRAYLTPTDDPRLLGRLGGYGVVGLIGCGGFGVVLKAFDAALNRYVAIKALSPQL